MIYFVSCPQQAITHKSVAQALPNFRRISYPVLFGRRNAPRGVYIFSDFDRLGFWQLELAAIAFRHMKNAGCKVLNDPALALQRLCLLRQLFRTGVNTFNAWAASEVEAVDRFPVFVRTASAHRGVVTGLIDDQKALEEAINAALEAGYPLSDLIVVEYKAEPTANGIFRKLAVYKVGSQLIPSPSVYERQWTAKYGNVGAAGEEGYKEDLRDIIDERFCGDAERAFADANIDYGRADFGLVNGRCEFYEINTNPSIEGGPHQHPFSARIDAIEHCESRLLAAIASLDAKSFSGRVKLDFESARPNRARRDKILPGYLWTP